MLLKRQREREREEGVGSLGKKHNLSKKKKNCLSFFLYVCVCVYQNNSAITVQSVTVLECRTTAQSVTVLECRTTALLSSLKLYLPTHHHIVMYCYCNRYIFQLSLLAYAILCMHKSSFVCIPFHPIKATNFLYDVLFSINYQTQKRSNKPLKKQQAHVTTYG